MKPKLIVINGPLGSGKSTLARMYADKHPITLKLDIDQVWAFISGWRDEPDLTTSLAKRMASAMAEIHLKAAHDVVIPQFYHDENEYIELESMALRCNAGFYEVFLDISKQEAIDRYVRRGQAAGNPDGFRPGSIIKRMGGVTKLEAMYDQSRAVTRLRPNTITITPRLDAVEETYVELMDALNASSRT